MELSEYISNTSKLNQFESKGVETSKDLAFYLPRKYYDFSKITAVKDLKDGETAAVHIKIKELYDGIPSTAYAVDRTGDSIKIVFFGNLYLFGRLEKGKGYIIGGKVSFWNGYPSITNPILISRSFSDLSMHPVYPKISGMSEDYLRKQIEKAIEITSSERVLSERDSFAKKLGLDDFSAMLSGIHFPKDEKQLEDAKLRLDYELIRDFYERLALRKERTLLKSVCPFKSFDKSLALMKSLPFPLTSGQKDALTASADYFARGERLNAVVSGDVGCGKTLVAQITCLMAAENGYQSAVLAPTKVLASQHYEGFKALLEPVGIRVEALYGDTKKKDRARILKDLAAGDVDVLVGTHAILSSEVIFKDLGLTITDEEQKFGTKQKELLDSGDRAFVHHLAMTATPIPRSMAKTLFSGETKVLQIKDLPNGRSPVATSYTSNIETAFGVVREEVEKGHKAYIVSPFIEDSNSDAFKNVISLEEALRLFEKYLKENPGFAPKYTSISGDMKAKDIEANVDSFANGDTDILFSTSIVEVGVNVPSASAIVILGADRFGLASLHQMRGRVGRSSIKSCCVLYAPCCTERIEIMTKISNGFDIAEEDFRLRGPGDVFGIDQTGRNEEIEAILRRQGLAEKVKKHILGD